MKVNINAKKIGSVLNADHMDVHIRSGTEANEVEVEVEVEVDLQVLDEFATVFSERDQAAMLLHRAGFPSARIPGFTNPLVFWTQTLEAARNGIMAGGVQPLIDAAAALFPNNAVFASAAGSQSRAR
jgi:Effector-associated domain 1